MGSGSTDKIAVATSKEQLKRAKEWYVEFLTRGADATNAYLAARKGFFGLGWFLHMFRAPKYEGAKLAAFEHERRKTHTT